MSSRNGQLAFSPEEVQQPKRGIRQQALDEDAKQTYVIIIKQEDESGHVEEIETTGSVSVVNSSSLQSLDSVRKNLTNIEDDEYDSGISAANLFLKDDELEDVEEAEGLVLPSAKRTRIHEDPPQSIPVSIAAESFGAKGFVKRNLFFDDLSPITPPTGSVYTNIVTSASPDLFPANTTSKGASMNTPTPSLDYKTHPAVRKIILVSPNQCQSSPNVSTPNSAAAVKALYSSSPLASSTPITSDSGFNVSTTSPDSGISLSVSSLSTSNILTPSSHEVSTTVATPSSSCPTHDLLPASVTTVQSGPGQPIETKITFCRRPMARIERKESEQSDEGQGDKSLDTSLANIQWLGGFQLGEKPPPHKTGPPTVATRWTSEERGRRKEYNQEEIIRVNRECGRVKRPPYSYMVLIQMALQSREDQKMTLREICKWIEETFSFYKHTAKPGWKNSIRHNLSYYQCFVRTSEDKKKHGARWTLKFDDERVNEDRNNKDKMSVSCGAAGAQIPGMIPLFVNQHNPNMIPQSMMPMHTAATASHPQLFPFQACIRRKRTGPMPILPRPSPVQAYALVPLHSVQQQQPQPPPQTSPFIFHIPPSQTPQIAPDNTAQNAPIPIACAPPRRQEKSILPNTKSATSTNSAVNILQQAWLNADISEDENVSLTSLLKEQGIAVTAQSAKKPVNKQSKTSTSSSSSQGLPKPKIYAPKSKKRTRSRVTKLAKVPEEKELLAESSDSETDDQFEKGLPTPLRQLFQSPDEKTKPEHVTTSTPVRNATLSPDHLPSPIRGWTPLRNSGGFDGSFLDILQEEAVHALKLLGSPQGPEGQKLGRSPNTSLTEFGIFQISPDKGNPNLSDCQLQGLSRIFADFDPNFMTDADGMPVDIANFNWSGLQQPSPKDDDKT